MFIPQDLYLASGTAQLLNNWVDPVYKFDSSSFYNWEQDNLPIYDLEDRDDYLFEMNGYPSSSIDGFMLTVSDCGIDNKKVFATISDAIDALPKKIRFPVIIEVATSGPLGGLHLESRDFEGSGAGIEVINRGFARALCGSNVGSSSTITTLTTNPSSILTFTSQDLSNTMTDSKSLGVSSTVWVNNSKGASVWWNYYTRAFIQTPEWSRAAAAASERTVTMSSKFGDTNAAGFQGGVTNIFNVTTYEDNSASSDIVITNKANDANIQRSYIVTGTDTRAPGMVYANDLSGVTVKDCTGRVYIRGFCVDGGSQADITVNGSQRTNVGFDIQNSEVVIENCTAARCKDAGMQAVNSNVTLNRGFIAFHNYQLSTAGGGSYLGKKITANPTPGLRAINSNITLSTATEEFRGQGIDALFSFYRNMVGIELQNSELVTPPNCRGGTASPTNLAGVIVPNDLGGQQIVLQSFFNVDEGIKSKNSLIETGYRISSFQNKIGIKLENSTFKVAEFSVDHNQDAGIEAYESVINYNKNGVISWTNGPLFPVTQLANNGQHALLNSSQFIPTYVPSGMSTNYGVLSVSDNHGIQQRNAGNSKQTLPAVVLDSGSYMQAIGTKAQVLTATADGTSYKADGAVKGALFRVVNQSKLDLFGHGTVATTVVGPYLWSKQQKAAGLYAGNNSHIYIAGPTTIAQFGVDALAEDNSTVELGPHLKNGIIDASGWNLGLVPGSNQTQVQLHATRACLVANRNSTINMHDMGDYHARWNSKYITNPDYPTGAESGGYNFSAYCSAGYVQFYPNPFTNYGITNLISQASWPTATGGIGGGGASPGHQQWPWHDYQIGGGVSALSYGGMCVRAVGGSQVMAKNIWFPTGWANPSGAVYDLSTEGDNCDLLRIWNIADDSELHASYLSVGNTTMTAGAETHPQDASGLYYGPSAVWFGGTNQIGYSGAPSSTPDTSSLSILDSFGPGVDTDGTLGIYGKTYPENIGPFRIYVSPHPKAKFLGYPISPTTGAYIPPVYPAAFVSMGFNFTETAILYKGAPYQLFAQGYNPSGDCSATNTQGPNYTNPSAIYEDLGFSAYITSLPLDQQVENVASSFYYTSAMLPYDTENRIWLDESAMNTFANAKNGTLNTSGRKKIFGYYKATTDYPGEADWNGDSGFGKGFGTANLFDLDRDL